ncbi:MAG: phage tail protein [Roseiarcus sp.]|jgi:phage tail P2-like protein
MSAIDLLPPNATPFERAQSAEDNRVLAANANAIRAERQPATCDEAFIAPLAWERSIHFWAPGDDAGNRARIASSFADHGSYGSPPALEQEIALDTGLDIAVREFWEIAGLVWPDFVVDCLINIGDPAPSLAAVTASANTRKNVRDVLARVRFVAAQPAAALSVAAATCVNPRVKILPLNAAPPPPQIYVGASTRALPHVTILPLRAA